MAGFLEQIGLTPKTPDLKRVDLDPESQALLNASVTRASADPSSFADATNQGIDERTGQLGQSNDSLTREGARRGQDPAMLQAIEGVYGQKAKDQIGRIKSQNEMAAPLRKSEALQGISAAALGAQQAKNQFYQQLTDAYNQSEANRAQLVSTIFQAGTQGYMNRNLTKGLQLGQAQNPGASNSSGLDYQNMA